MRLLTNRIAAEKNNDNATEILDSLADEIHFIRLILDWGRMTIFRIIWITRNIITSERFNYTSLRDSHSSVST